MLHILMLHYSFKDEYCRVYFIMRVCDIVTDSDYEKNWEHNVSALVSSSSCCSRLVVVVVDVVVVLVVVVVT